ncbi:MAG: hypothetical protein A2284_10600 [Deltaproteobacteria bacterium RIFOXYA12_FULL_61_11]|nr:MAG: hypothetical protein A2284_10600 [Deltaproteobacteria bacterium RIFOXYA12_FULL_61_11]
MLSSKILEFSLIGAEWVLWLLLVLSVASLAVIFNRLLLFLSTRDKLLPIFYTTIQKYLQLQKATGDTTPRGTMICRV